MVDRLVVLVVLVFLSGSIQAFTPVSLCPATKWPYEDRLPCPSSVLSVVKARKYGEGGGGGGSDGGGGRSSSQGENNKEACREINNLIIASARDPEAILDIVDRYSGLLNDVNAATAINRLSWAASGTAGDQRIINDPRFYGLLGIVRVRLDRLDAYALATVINGLVKLECHPGRPFLEAFSMRVRRQIGGFKALGLALVMNGFAKLKFHPGPDVMEAIVRRAERRIDEFNPQQLSITLNGMSKLGFVPSREFLDLCVAKAAPRIPEFEPQHLSVTLNAFQRMGYHPREDFLLALDAHALKRLRGFSPQEISNTLHAWGKLGHHPPRPVLDAFVARVMQALDEFNPQMLAMLINGLANLNMASPAILQAFTDTSRRLLPGFSPEGLAAIINSYAKLEYFPGEKYLLEFTDVARLKLEAFDSQGLANTIHGLSKLGYSPANGFLEEYQRQALLRMEEFTPQELSNIIWAFGRTGWTPSEDFTAAFTRVTLSQLGCFNAQELANTINSIAKLGLKPGPDFMPAFIQAADKNLADFDPQELALTLNGLARLGNTPPLSFLDDVTQAVAGKMGAFKPVELGMTCNSFAKFNHDPGHMLLSLITRQAVALQDDFVPQDYANLLNAFASLRWEPGDDFWTGFTGWLSRYCQQDLPQGWGHDPWRAVHIGVMIWSVAALGWPEAAVPAVGILAGLAGREEVIQTEELLLPQIYTQLRLALVAHDLVGGGKGVDVDREEWEVVRARLDQVWADGWREEVGDTTPSTLHLGVLSVLEGPLGAEGRCSVEVVDNKGAYILDIVVRPISSQSRLLPMVVEVDGPGHFLGPTRRIPNGPTAMKRSLLEAEVGRRWAVVVTVPYFEWNEAKGGGGAQGLLSVLISRALAAQGLDPADYITVNKSTPITKTMSASAATTTISGALEGKTLKDLRDRCRQLNLAVSGTKKQLVDRLLSATQEGSSQAVSPSTHSVNSRSSNSSSGSGTLRDPAPPPSAMSGRNGRPEKAASTAKKSPTSR